MSDPQLDRFFRENFPVIRAKCARMLGAGEEAADVAQETFVRLCETGAVHQDVDARLRWIYVTSTRLAIDLLRRRRLGVERRAHEGMADVPVAAPDRPADRILSARQTLATIAAGATPDELQVAVLCRLDGLTQPEAAKLCGLSERTVRRLLARFDERVADLAEETP